MSVFASRAVTLLLVGLVSSGCGAARSRTVRTATFSAATTLQDASNPALVD